MPDRTTFEDEGQLQVTVRYPFTRHGTVVTFEGEDDLGRTVTFGADWRVAQDIIEALYDDQEPVALVEPWSILTIEDPEPEPPVTTITVGTEGTTVRAADGQEIRTPVPTDLGLTEADTILHDAAHAILAAHVGLTCSPVLERVAEARSLSQDQVDLEEAATFAIQAWCASLRGDSHGALVANAREALLRLTGDNDYRARAHTAERELIRLRTEHGL